MINKRLNSPSSTTDGPNWKIPLLLGMIVTLVVGIVLVGYRLIHPPIDAETVRFATQNGYDVQTFADIQMLMNRSDKSKTLDERDWQRLKMILRDPDPSLRSRAIDVLMNVRKSPYTPEAIALGKTFLNDPNGQFQASALLLLWKMHDSSLSDEIAKRTNTSDDMIQNAIRIIRLNRNKK